MPFARLSPRTGGGQLTATGGNCGLPSIASVRLVVEPKPGLLTDPNDIRAFIDVFTDLSNLFVVVPPFRRASQRAWVLTGSLVAVRPSVAASAGRDGDDR